jgi:hypothetical protein
MKLEGKTNAELLALREAIEADPVNQIPRGSGSIYLYTPKARKKLDEITEWISHNLLMARKARGEVINIDGYSGRKCKRRR